MEQKKEPLSLHQIEWAAPRHQMIATAAYSLLSDKTQRNLKLILGNASLAQVSTWADEIKYGKAPNDPDTIAFLRENKTSAKWHFVDLPLGCGAYGSAESQYFTRKDDIVQMLTASVHAATNSPGQFTPLNALRLIVHLVADIHQPLHVACGYIRVSAGTFEIVKDPDDAKACGIDATDHGGNRLTLPNGINLHSYWDGHLGPEDNEYDSTKISQAAGHAYRDFDVVESPSEWATQSLIAARTAYQFLKVATESVAETFLSNKTTKAIKVSWTEDETFYRSKCLPIARERILAAVTNLGNLLSTIYT